MAGFNEIYEDDHYYEDDDQEMYNCPKCGREYIDEASIDFGICDYCRWSAMDKKYV